MSKSSTSKSGGIGNINNSSSSSSSSIHKFNLDLGAVQTRIDEVKYQNSFQQEKATFSITPRTFVSRTLHPMDTASIIVKLGQLLQYTEQTLSNASTNGAIIDLGLIASNVLKQTAKCDVSKASDQEKYNKFRLIHHTSDILDAAQQGLDNLQKAYNFISNDSQTIFNFFVDKYQNQEGNVTSRYGIAVDQNLMNSIDTFNAAIQGIPVPSVSSVSTRKSNSSSKRSKKIANDTNKLLHLIELALIQEALKNIEQGDKTVLIEIFARDSENQILFETRGSDKLPELHTVALYKMPGQGNKQVLMLDPSSTEHSRHLALGINKLLFKSTNDQDLELIAPLKKMLIYTSVAGKDNNGPNSDQGRDCIDIAVKLAFAINKEQEPLGDLRNLIEWKPVIEISNNQGIDRGFLATDYITLIKQSSDDSVRSKYFNYNKKFNELLNMVKLVPNLRPLMINFESTHNKLMEQEINWYDYTILLQKDLNYDNLYKLYYDLNHGLVDYLGDAMQELDSNI